MKSSKCFQCGFVGWSEGGHCKSCGASLSDRQFAAPANVQQTAYSQIPEEGPKKGLAMCALILGIISFLTLGLLGVGAITGIIIAAVALSKIKRDPWQYGGKGLAIAGLVLNITALASVVPVAMIAAIAIPNLLAARMAANEGSAIISLRTLSAAESTFQSDYGRFGTLDELAANNLIDGVLANGSKSGYRFSVEVSKDGFQVVGVPLTYRSSGVRSFLVDESLVIRAADNRGFPPTVMDEPLGTMPGPYRREVRY